jgi:hypothetical protein
MKCVVFQVVFLHLKKYFQINYTLSQFIAFNVRYDSNCRGFKQITGVKDLHFRLQVVNRHETYVTENPVFTPTIIQQPVTLVTCTACVNGTNCMHTTDYKFFYNTCLLASFTSTLTD